MRPTKGAEAGRKHVRHAFSARHLSDYKGGLSSDVG